jgi:hypothetical protein
MTTTYVRSIAFGAIALVTLVASASAQTTSSAILNTLEVQRLIKSAEPGDHTRLSVHFAALAARYADEAKRHTAMAQAFVGTPTRRVAANSAADHCKRLATLGNESAETLRELAAHHEQLAGGIASTVPRNSGPFEAGKGASVPTEQELNILAAKATTTTEHGALREYFMALAKRYTADANEHAEMAQAYRGTRIAQSAAHCDRLVKLSRESAKEANAAARVHEEAATGKR